MNNDHLVAPMLSSAMDEVILMRARIEALEAARTADLQMYAEQLEANTTTMDIVRAQEAELRYEAGMYKSLYDVAKARIEALEAALRKIVRGEGPYSPDRYEHIKGLQEVARAALDKDVSK